MHPRLQTAFDVMYSRAEQFLSRATQKHCNDIIDQGKSLEVPAFVADDLLRASVKITPSNAQAHRAAVAAFGAFWNVFTELSYGVKEGK